MGAPTARSAPPARPISLCVINFNGARHLRETLPAIAALGDRFAEVLLVDNGSTDDSVAVAKQLLPQARVLALAENRGPGAARNAGFRAATADRVLFLDNDVEPAPDCHEELARALDADPGAAIAMPRVLYRAAPDTIQYDGAGSHFMGVVHLEHPDTAVAAAPAQTRPIDSLISACFLVDRTRWSEPTLFDESFFIYQEDHDLGLRARLAGWRILAVPAARCFHGDGTPGLSLRSTGRYQSLRVLGTIRNRWLVLLKNYELRTLLLLAPALATYEAFQLAGVVRKGWGREYVAALGSVAGRWREIAAERRRIQRTRVTPDREVLRGGSIPFAPQLARGRVERVAQTILIRVVDGYWSWVRRLL